MNRSLFAVVLAALLPACSSGSPSDPGASLRSGESCTPPDGSYLFHYEETSGTCGKLPDQIVNFGASNAGGSSDCTTTGDADRTTCTVRTTTTCPGTTYTGYLDFSPDGSNAVGEATVSVRSCASTYRITAKRR